MYQLHVQHETAGFILREDTCSWLIVCEAVVPYNYICGAFLCLFHKVWEYFVYRDGHVSSVYRMLFLAKGRVAISIPGGQSMSPSHYVTHHELTVQHTTTSIYSTCVCVCVCVCVWRESESFLALSCMLQYVSVCLFLCAGVWWRVSRVGGGGGGGLVTPISLPSVLYTGFSMLHGEKK